MENGVMHFVWFALIGVLGMVWDFGSTWLLKEKMHVNAFLATSIGFVLGVCNNYVLNAAFNYRQTNLWESRNILSFFLLNILALGVNILVIYICNRKMKVPFYWSKIIASGFGTILNFTVSHFWIFSH